MINARNTLTRLPNTYACTMRNLRTLECSTAENLRAANGGRSVSQLNGLSGEVK